MIVYDSLGENVEKKQFKKIKKDLVSLVAKCGGLPVTFSNDNTVGIYKIPEEGLVIFHDYKRFIRVWLDFNKESKLPDYFLSEFDRIKEYYK